jgi:hypothetical protein
MRGIVLSLLLVAAVAVVVVYAEPTNDDTFLLKYLPELPRWATESNLRISKVLPKGYSVWQVVLAIISSEFAIIFNLILPVQKHFSGIKSFCYVLILPTLFLTLGKLII